MGKTRSGVILLTVQKLVPSTSPSVTKKHNTSSYNKAKADGSAELNGKMGISFTGNKLSNLSFH